MSIQKLAEDIKALKLHPATSEEYNAGYQDARYDAWLIAQEAADKEIPNTTDPTVFVTVSGLTGSGKSAVLGEIEIALNALGVAVEHDDEFQSEKNMTHADWQEALDLYKPTVVLREVNIPLQTTPTK